MKIVNSLKKKLRGIKIPSLLNAIVVGYAGLVAIVAFLWVAHWLGYFPYAGSLEELTAFIQTVVATNSINCLYSIARGFVDSDGDGIPDAFDPDTKA